MYDNQTVSQRMNRSSPDGQGLRKGILGRVTMHFRMKLLKIKLSVEMAADLCIQKCRQGSDCKKS